MQSRFTARGVTNDDKEVILAYELKEEEFKVDLYIVPKKLLKGDAAGKLEQAWVEGEPYEFPDKVQMVTPNLNAESILPDDIRSEEAGKIRTKQNEWAYQLLTAKLWESFLLELEELKKKAEELTQYDRQLFEDAKSFWERVLEHKKERDISQERLDKIKDDVNSVFEKLKTFRKTESAEFEAASAKLRDEVVAKVEDVKNRADEKANFKSLIEELKTIQGETRKNRYTKSDDQLVRKAFDAAFQHVNEQRNRFFSDKTESRIKGLTEVIEKMEASLARDRRDLDYLAKKGESSRAKPLELQLLKVKTNMLNETIVSKEAKLKDIHATLEKLQKQAQKSNKHVVNDEAQNEEVEKSADEDAPAAEGPAHPDKPNSSGGE